jgi:hypothetical protein
MDSSTQKRKTYDSCMKKSAGKWEKLTYKVLNAAKMRNFIKYI